MTDETTPISTAEPLWPDERVDAEYSAAADEYDDKAVLYKMRDEMQVRIDELAVALVVEQAQTAKLQSQLAEARGDSGPNPIVEWKGWKVELDFGEDE